MLPLREKKQFPFSPLHGFFTKSKLMLKQCTSIAITQLQRCKIPPSKLTADLILSVVAGSQNALSI
jgi:hypothetical protein